MKKNILKVYYNSVVLSVWFLALLPLALLVSMFALFGTSNDPLWVIILFTILLLSFSLFFIITALYRTQRAEISELGITIYSIFFSTIKVIKWNELIDVRTESIVTFTSSYGYSSSKDWIVLYTDSSQIEKVHNGINNRKKKGPWYIACTKENLTVITEYIIKYAPHICDDLNVFF
ncbi:MAG: hypothetical protein IJX97_01655 [Clostridia bacterium]|nr:hypothetical protein [Clostridia bacterium]